MASERKTGLMVKTDWKWRIWILFLTLSGSELGVGSNYGRGWGGHLKFKVTCIQANMVSYTIWWLAL